MDSSDFDPSVMRLSSLGDCKAGDFVWHWMNSNGTLETSVLLGQSPFPGNQVALLGLTGAASFRVEAFDPTRSAPVLRTARGPYRVEICRTHVERDYAQHRGALVLTNDGAYIFAQGRDIGGFQTEYYVSLSDWSVRTSLSGTSHLTVSAWRLVSADGQGEDRTVIELAPSSPTP
jgi:hypothetical protein